MPRLLTRLKVNGDIAAGTRGVGSVVCLGHVCGD